MPTDTGQAAPVQYASRELPPAPSGNCDAIRAGAAAFTAGADALDRVVAQLDAARLQAFWRGPGSRAFDATLAEVRTGLTTGSDTFRQAAAALDQLAAKIQHAIDIRHAAEIAAAAVTGVSVLLGCVTFGIGLAGAASAAAELAVESAVAAGIEQSAIAVARQVLIDLLEQFGRKLLINFAKNFAISTAINAGIQEALTGHVDVGNAVLTGTVSAAANGLYRPLTPVGTVDNYARAFGAGVMSGTTTSEVEQLDSNGWHADQVNGWQVLRAGGQSGVASVVVTGASQAAPHAIDRLAGRVVDGPLKSAFDGPLTVDTGEP